MKLYLSSHKIPAPDELHQLLGKPVSEAMVVIIPNASDYYAERAWQVKTLRTVELFQSLGYRKISVVDLREFTDMNKLNQELSKADLIWVRGGNTFCLRYAMRRSGFDTVIHDLLRDGIVYGGESAGAIVAGTSLDGIELMDEPEFAEEVLTDGLCLVEEYILPHVDNNEYSGAVVEMRKRRTNMIELTDAEVYIVEGNDERIAIA